MRLPTVITLIAVTTLTAFGAGRPAPRARLGPSPQQAPPPAAEDLDALNRRVRELYDAKKYEEAAKLAQAALEAAERQTGPDSLQTSAALMNLASAQWARGEREKARKALLRLFANRAKRPGPSQKFEQNALELFACLTASDLKAAPDPELVKRLHHILVEDSVLEQGYRLSPDRGELKGGEPLSKPPPRVPATRTSGGVVLRITIDEGGRVVEAKPLGCSSRMLVDAAAEAALRATYHPTLFGGKPVRVSSIIFYRFVFR